MQIGFDNAPLIGMRGTIHAVKVSKKGFDMVCEPTGIARFMFIFIFIFMLVSAGVFLFVVGGVDMLDSLLHGDLMSKMTAAAMFFVFVLMAITTGVFSIKRGLQPRRFCVEPSGTLSFYLTTTTPFWELQKHQVKQVVCTHEIYHGSKGQRSDMYSVYLDYEGELPKEAQEKSHVKIEDTTIPASVKRIYVCASSDPEPLKTLGVYIQERTGCEYTFIAKA